MPRAFIPVCARALSPAVALPVFLRFPSPTSVPAARARTGAQTHTHTLTRTQPAAVISPPLFHASLFARSTSLQHINETHKKARVHVCSCTSARKRPHTQTHTHLLPELLVELVLVGEARADGQRHGAARDEEEARAQSAQFGSEREDAR